MVTRSGSDLSKPLAIVPRVINIDCLAPLRGLGHARTNLAGHGVVAPYRWTGFHGFEPAREMGIAGFSNTALGVPFAPGISGDVGDGVFIATKPGGFRQAIVQHPV